MRHYPECPAGWTSSDDPDRACCCYEIDMQRRHEEIDDRWWEAHSQAE